jgi:biopolymer transport protein ExbB
MRQRIVWLSLAIFAVAGTWRAAMVRAQGQDAKAPAAKAPAAAAPAEGAKPAGAADADANLEKILQQAAAPAAPAPAAPAAAAPEAAPAASAANRQSMLSWLYGALGPLYSVSFHFLSFSGVALVVMNIMQLRRDNFMPEEMIQTFESHLNEKRYQEAYDLAKNDESFVGQVLSAGLAKLSQGYDHAIEAMQEVGEEENMKLQQRLGYLALIGTISPMVGLLGTVDGMVKSFSVIAASTTQPKPSELAHGIELALVTTLVGLQIAIPAIAVYNILKNRLDRLVLQVGIVSEGLMSRFSNVGPSKK